LAIKDTTKPHYRSSFCEFKKYVSLLTRKASPYKDNECINTVIKPLREGIRAINVYIAAIEEAADTSKSVVEDSTRSQIFKATSINVELPKFDGNTIHCRHFETLLLTAFRTKASRFNNLDKSCLLMDAIKFTEAREVVHTYPDKDAP